MLGDINYELGIDIGGTFTDLTLKEIDGAGIWNVKTPTVPKDPASGISNGLQLLKEKGIDLTKISYFVHGMTIGLNTLPKWSKNWLIRNRGFPRYSFNPASASASTI